MKIRILVNEGEYRLSKAGVMDAKIDAEELLCHVSGWDKVMLFLKKEEEAGRELEEKYFELIDKRAKRIPLQHITGTQEFMGFEFRVAPDVLIPRQDTEVLVTEAAQVLREEYRAMQEERKKQPFFRKLKSAAACDVLDMCCGSGAVGISLAKICENISVTAADISREALMLAAANAKALHAEVEFIRGDMFKALDEGERFTERGGTGRSRGSRVREFGMIVSNPPYIKTTSIAMLQAEVKDHEPLIALDGGRDGLNFYRIIVSGAASRLKKGGWLIMEIGYDQGEDVRKMIMDSGEYTPAEVIKDLPGKDRVIKCKKL